MKSRMLNSIVCVASFLIALIAFLAAASAQNPVPLINQPLVPDATKPGGAGFTLTVNGAGFVSGSVVHWNGSARATTFVSPSKLTATIAASDIAKPTTPSVTVVNPGPGGGTSNVIFFDVASRISHVVLNRTAFGTGSISRPDSVGVGDFNGDGKLDLAVADFISNTVTILLGNGDGTFQAGVGYATQSGPGSVIVSDFNGDGKLDLAVRNSSSNSVSILLGNGDGTFGTAFNFATGNDTSGDEARQIAGDFNGDGKLDLVVTNFNDDTVSVLLGNGDGTFQAHRDYPAGPSPLGVTTGDFNGDGKLDLALANLTAAHTVSILLGNGDGTFQSPVAYATESAPIFIAVADFNGDGKLDLAVANDAGVNTVSILLGNGDGTFRPHVDYAVGGAPSMVATADIDADGKLDLAVANQGDGTVSILRGNGDGTFGVANNFVAGSTPAYVAFADFNRDGRFDLAVASPLDDAVAVMLETTTVTVLPSMLNFATRLVGSKSSVQTVTLTNTGQLTLTIRSIATTGTNPSDFSQTNNCPASLPPGAHCTISVIFQPTQLGPRTASISITDNAVGSPRSVPLSGIGVTSGPNATLSTTSLTFAMQLVGTHSPAQTFTLNNFGTATLTSSMNLTGADPGDFSQINTCGGSVGPGGNCTISVTFTPKQGGSRTATLAVTDNAPGSPQTVSLQGTSTIVELNPTSLSFGNQSVGTAATQSTTLTNVGSTALSIAGIAIAGLDTDEFRQTNTCGTSVGAGKSCAIAVTFTPAEIGGDSAAVFINDNGGLSPQHVSLSGNSCYSLGHSCTPGTSNQCCSHMCSIGNYCCDRPLLGMSCNSSADCCRGLCINHECS